MQRLGRRLAGAALIYGLGGVVSRMVSLLLLPLFTRFLTVADYGVLALLGIMTTLLAGAVHLGTGNSIGIGFHEAVDADERSRVVWSMAVVVCISASAWVVFGILASAWISKVLFHTTAYSVPVRLAFGQMATSAMALPLLGWWRLEERARPFVIATVSLTATTGFCNAIAVAFLHLGLLGMLWSTLLAQVTYCVVLYAIFVYRRAPRPSQYWAVRLVRLGWPSVFGVGAFFALDFGDRIILERLAGLKSVGLYSIGVSFGLGMSILAEGAFGAAWPGFFSSFLNRQEEARQVFGRVLHYYLVIFLTLGAAFFLFARPLVFLMTAPPFHESAKVVGLIAMCNVLKGVYLIFLPGFYFNRKLHVQTGLEWSGALVGLAACLLLIPRFGIVGAALGPLSGYVFLSIATILMARRYLMPSVDKVRTALLGLSFLGVVAISYVDFCASTVILWLLRAAVWIVYIAFFWSVFVDHSFRDMKQELSVA